MAATDLLNPGQIFAGRYRIDRFLAKGGFGAVYAAEQLETELAVALKVLWPHVLHSKDAVEKFKLEARVAGRVGSEHIVRVFDAGFDAETAMPFLVMELLKGAHLERVVETQGPLSGDTLSKYFRQIASALDKAHGYVDRDGVARPIVHRDLKPENLYLCERETGEPIVKVLDFGIAKVLSASTNVSQEVKGTPLYMAFEQASSEKITPQTDIWALGLIAFFLLTGKNYWRSANHQDASITQLFGEVLSLPIEPPTQRARELGCGHLVGPGFDAWFSRCVNRNAAERFTTAGECAAALTSMLTGAATGELAMGATVAVLSPPPATHVAAASTASGAVGATTAQPLSISAAAPELPKKRSAAPLVAVGVALAGLAGAALLTLRPTEPPSTIDSAIPSIAAGSASPAQPEPPVTSATAEPSATPPLGSASAAPSSNPASEPPRAGQDKRPRPPVNRPPNDKPPSTVPTVGVYDDR